MDEEEENQSMDGFAKILGAFEILYTVLIAASWPIIMGINYLYDGEVSLGSLGSIIFYVVSWIFVALNVWLLFVNHRDGYRINGPVLAIVGYSLMGITPVLALPAFILSILATVFTMLHEKAR